MKAFICLSAVFLFFAACGNSEDQVDQGITWEKITLDIIGPHLSESGSDNPFLNYRLDVRFSLGDHVLNVPGFFAADGNAAETSADEGTVWRVNFRPDRPGTWSYKVSFRKGNNIAISAEEGEAVAFDGQSGKIEVAQAPTGTKGRLRYVGLPYLQFAGDKSYFLKGGADSPENFLGYADFDNTLRYTGNDREGEASADDALHRYQPHLEDWMPGDPSWQDGKGKAMIGALNYLAGKGMNVVYMLTMNIEGDGKDVWPYVSHTDFQRFDCSKLAQWEIVFDHMDELGLMQHLVLQETENEKLLDDGDTSFDRKLYYREMIARFAHHPMVTWNMGEENGPAHWTPEGQTIEQRNAMIAYFRQHDPYDNLVVIHSHSHKGGRDSLFMPHLGNKDLDGMSMQVSNKTNIHHVTQLWAELSHNAGRPWVLNMDEIGKHWRGVDPDDRPDNNQDSVRQEALWGSMMAGAAGSEWYFGYRNAHNDLGCEDWRSRDRMWDYTRFALEFFQEHLPFSEMKGRDDLLQTDQAYCLAKEGEIYAIYLKQGGPCRIDLSAANGDLEVFWYNPRSGGALTDPGYTLTGGGIVDLGLPPADVDLDWVALIRKPS